MEKSVNSRVKTADVFSQRKKLWGITNALSLKAAQDGLLIEPDIAQTPLSLTFSGFTDLHSSIIGILFWRHTCPTNFWTSTSDTFAF
jgi:hypothetical protein